MNTLKLALAAATALAMALAGCGANAVLRYGPDGEPEYFIDCSNKPLGDCYKKALRVCPQGYFLIQAKETPQGSKTGSVFGRWKSVGGAKADQEIKWKNHLVVRCK